MRVLVSGSPNLRRLLGKQILRDRAVRYRPIKYLLKSDYMDGILLLNVMTGQLIMLDEEETVSFNQLPAADISGLQELVEGYFIVPIEFDEQRMVTTLRKLMNRVLTPKGIQSFTILTTTNCNARCFYCYEKKLSRLDMKEVMAMKIVDFIQIRKAEGPIKLGWFGGEPLVCSERISEICSLLKARNVEFTSTMTSNGYLFSEELAKKAVSVWNLKQVQITLDGTRSVYNRVKNYVNPDMDPFDRVLTNIELLLKSGVFVTIRLHVDQFNKDDIRNLADELKNRLGGYDHLSVYTHFLLNKEEDSKEGMHSPRIEEAVQNQLQLTRYLKSIGLLKENWNLPGLRRISCGADSENSVVIYPDGRLFKCIDIIEDDLVGNIDDAGMNEIVLAEYRERFDKEECKECPLFPNCLILNKCPDYGKRTSTMCKYHILSETEKIRPIAERILNNHEGE